MAATFFFIDGEYMDSGIDMSKHFWQVCVNEKN